VSYTANTPISSQPMSQSRPIINANFQALAPFGNGYAELTNQLVAPTFGAGNDGMYTLNYATTGKNEAYIHLQNFAGTSDIPFTASKMSNTAAASCTSGWAYLPNGMLMKWGRILAPSAIIFTVNVGSLSGGPNYNTVVVDVYEPITDQIVTYPINTFHSISIIVLTGSIVYNTFTFPAGLTQNIEVTTLNQTPITFLAKAGCKVMVEYIIETI